MRVLLVDDEVELVSALGERLTLRGIDAEWVNSGQEALRRVEHATYDMAVLDMKMPGIGGFELKKRLQARCPDLKFIFMTGYGSETEFKVVEADLGQNHYLVKPVDIRELIRTMDAVMRAGGGA